MRRMMSLLQLGSTEASQSELQREYRYRHNQGDGRRKSRAVTTSNDLVDTKKRRT